MSEWSRKYKCCIECGGTDRKHNGRGRCTKCSQGKAYKTNPDKFKVRSRAAYWKDPVSHRSATLARYYSNKELHLTKCREYRETRNFDGKREAILERDKRLCRICGQPGNIVHHADLKGRGHPHPNNNDNNLITLCRSCHMKLHKPRRNYAKK